MEKQFKAIKGSKPVLKKFTTSTPTPEKEEITINIRLKNKPSAGSKSGLLEILGSQLPGDKEHFRRDDLERMHGVNLDDIEIVKQFAAEYQIEVTKINSAVRMVTLRGTPKEFNNAFKVNLENFASKMHRFRSHREAIQIPENLENIIEGVFGLDNQMTIEPRIPEVALTQDNLKASIKKRYSPLEVAQAYKFPKGATGKGQSIAIIALGGGYKFEDIKYYLEEIIGVPTPKITDVSVDDAKNSPGLNNLQDMEIVMDLEILAAIAHGAEIVVYFAPNTDQGFFNAVSAAVFDDVHKNSVISISWGKAECKWSKPIVESLNGLFQAAALLGITICVPSGDDGSDDGIEDGKVHVDFPASSPYVLSCGGTILTIEESKLKSEIVWNEKFRGKWWASGGGVSDFFSVPIYQQGLGISIKSVNPEKNTGRYVPDIAAIAGSPGYDTYLNKMPTEIPGGATSAAVPLWAALIALINEKLGTPVGYINPLLYKSAKKTGIFNDITSGNNDLDKLNAYKAEHGWDACTGLGSPNGEELLKMFQGK